MTKSMAVTTSPRRGPDPADSTDEMKVNSLFFFSTWQPSQGPRWKKRQTTDAALAAIAEQTTRDSVNTKLEASSDQASGLKDGNR
jgi:hypothetical protein